MKEVKNIGSMFCFSFFFPFHLLFPLAAAFASAILFFSSNSAARCFAFSSRSLRMSANRAISFLASSVFPASCNFLYLSFAAAASITSRSRLVNGCSVGVEAPAEFKLLVANPLAAATGCFGLTISSGFSSSSEYELSDSPPGVCCWALSLAIFASLVAFLAALICSRVN